MVESAWGLAYFGLLLQVMAGLIIWRLPYEPRLTLRLFAFLFFLNAGVSALMFLPSDGGLWLRSDPGGATRLFRALDGPTGPILLAMVAARSQNRYGRSVAAWLLALAAVHSVAELFFHEAIVAYDTYLRSIPFYVGLGVACWALAGGRVWERWVALALLPRGLYWGTAGLAAIPRGFSTELLALFLNDLGLLLLLGLTLAAVLRLTLSPGVPSLSVTFPILLVGPAAALLETTLNGTMPAGVPFRYGTYVMLNFLTLGLIRPFVGLLGLAPVHLLRSVLQSIGSALAGLVFIGIFSPLAGISEDPVLSDVAQFGFGLCVSLLALGLWEGVHHRRGSGMAAPSEQHPTGDPPGVLPLLNLGGPVLARATASPLDAMADLPVEESAPPPSVPLPPSSTPSGRPDAAGRPQWQQILIALQRSSLLPEVVPFAEPHLTQRSLVERTGISAPRVSMLTRSLEHGSSQWAQYFPDEAEASGRKLLHRHEGRVRGWTGVWVYYRLTPLGERLVEALLAESERS